MKTQSPRPAIAFLAPFSPARTAFFGAPYTSGKEPEAIVEFFTAQEPGHVHAEMANGEILTVETGKGYLFGVN